MWRYCDTSVPLQEGLLQAAVAGESKLKNKNSKTTAITPLLGSDDGLIGILQ